MKALHLMLTAATALPMASVIVSAGDMTVPENISTSTSTGTGGGGWKTYKRARHPESDIRPPYRIIIDGGSTGSRLHIFEFVYNATIQEVECIRRGSAKAWTPLSAFGRPPSHSTDPLNATEVADHLLPLFEYAADVIPERFHDITPATYQATAGMRLLDESEQKAVYDALYDGLISSDRFVFRNMKREDVTTLDGGREGFYGAVAANYLKGFVGADLKLKGSAPSTSNSNDGSDQAEDEDELHRPRHGPLGALDMGGASAQIVYLPEVSMGNGDEGSCSPGESHISGTGNGYADKTCSATDRLDGDAFFSTSYLAYGVDQFRERLWDVWIDDELRDADPNACPAKILTLSNPCGFKGHKQAWRGYTLVGTGDADACADQVRRLIPHQDNVVRSDDQSTDSTGDRVVGGIRHPPLRGKFYAMSLYFFTLDCLRELSGHEGLHLNWPTPSIEELTDALHGLCSRSWHGDLEEIQHNSHAFTNSQVLPMRCMESVYMVTLLRDGFGFHPESRDITFTFEVEGSEVEWSLGMALAQHAEDGGALASGVSVSSKENESSGGKDAHAKRNERDEMETNFTSERGCASQTCPSGLWA